MRGGKNFKDLIGRRFNMLLVIGEAYRDKNGVYWYVDCDCGGKSVVLGSNLPRTKSCGCELKRGNGGRRVKNLIGQKFGFFTVLARLPNKKDLKSTRSWSRWLVVCECGIEKEINGDELGRTISCGCSRKLPFGLQPHHSVFLDYKQNAKIRGLVFGLSESRVKELIRSDCYYCGLSLCDVRADLQEIAFNGIDRLDNREGYLEGNVVPCCKICNHAKNAMTEADFVAWALRFAQYQSNKMTLTPLNS